MADERDLIIRNIAELNTLLEVRTGQLIFAGYSESGHLNKLWLAVAASGKIELKLRKGGAGRDIRIPASHMAFKELSRPDLPVELKSGPLVLPERCLKSDSDNNPAGVFKSSATSSRTLLMIGDSVVRGWFEGQTTEYIEEIDLESDGLAYVKKPRCKNPWILILYLSMLNSLDKHFKNGWETDTLKSYRDELVQERNILLSGIRLLESIPESLRLSIEGCEYRLMLTENLMQKGS